VDQGLVEKREQNFMQRMDALVGLRHWAVLPKRSALVPMEAGSQTCISLLDDAARRGTERKRHVKAACLQEKYNAKMRA
jgi:hypothetical protein